MENTPMFDSSLFEVAKNEGTMFYQSESTKTIFADCSCAKFIQKCYDSSCYSQSVQRIDGCVTNAISFSDLKVIPKSIFIELWSNAPTPLISQSRYECPNCP